MQTGLFETQQIFVDRQTSMIYAIRVRSVTSMGAAYETGHLER